MKTNEMRNLKWIPVTDWSKLDNSKLVNRDFGYVKEKDFDIFVENVFKDIAQRLNIPYSEAREILVDKNANYYTLKSKLFTISSSYFFTDNSILELKRALMVPDVTSAPSVDKVLNDFSALTSIEQLEVLQRLGMVSIKIDFSK